MKNNPSNSAIEEGEGGGTEGTGAEVSMPACARENDREGRYGRE